MEIFSAFIIAFGFSLLYLAGYRDKALSRTYISLFFLILFMTGLAAQFWIIPFGPTIYGLAWMPVILMVLIVSLLFAAPSPYQNKWTKTAEKETPIPVPVGIFIWILLIVLLLAIIAGIFKKKYPDEPLRKIKITTANPQT